MSFYSIALYNGASIIELDVIIINVNTFLSIMCRVLLYSRAAAQWAYQFSSNSSLYSVNKSPVSFINNYTNTNNIKHNYSLGFLVHKTIMVCNF